MEDVQHVPNSSPKITETQVYINNHYIEHLILSQAASHLNSNEPYFRRLFKDEIQISSKSYVTLLQLAYAQKPSIASQRSINEITQEVGYNNITQFYKIFELDYNLTPAEYHRRYRDSYADVPPLQVCLLSLAVNMLFFTTWRDSGALDLSRTVVRQLLWVETCIHL